LGGYINFLGRVCGALKLSPCRVSAIQHLGTHIPSRPAAGIAQAVMLRLAELSEFGEDAKWSVMFSTGLSLLGFQRKGCGFVCMFLCHVSGKFWDIGRILRSCMVDLIARILMGENEARLHVKKSSANRVRYGRNEEPWLFICG